MYANFTPVYTFILCGVICITYIGGGILSQKKLKKSLPALLTVLTLLPLIVFKYYNFINDNVTLLLDRVGLGFSFPGLNWAIPVGISFFTFQALGYMLDVYYDRIKPEKSFLDYALFVSFFPQVASGPISKASELLPQIKKPHSFNYSQAVSGLKFFLWGMFLKVAIADRAGIYVDAVFNDYDSFSALGCIIASFMYSFQIYADFAGYSYMAVGVGKLLGFNLINNFNRPYFAVSISDFWHRWHISLSRWLKDYVYIPMGGSRCSKLRNYWNIIVTFLVSGIWHGANWTFIVWGLIHGLCQVVEKIFGWNKNSYSGLYRGSRIVITFVIVTIAWLIFRSSSITEAFSIISRFSSMSGEHIASTTTLVYFIIALTPLIVFEVLTEFHHTVYIHLASIKTLRWIVYLLLICLIMQIGVIDGSSFIYTSF